MYCDDLRLDSVPPLPKDTTHFYARYNRITKINKSDFAFMSMFLLLHGMESERTCLVVLFQPSHSLSDDQI